MKWSDKEHNHLIDLIQQHGTKWKLIAQKMSEKFGKKFRYDQVRSRYRMNKEKIKPIEYKETVEILADGTHKSDKLLRMTSEQAKDVNYLLKAHGFDTEEWELVSARNNIWNVYSKQDGIQTLYSSKITVKPKQNTFDFNKLIEIINKRKPLNPVKYKGILPEEPTYLEIPLFDLHFGNSTLEYYQNTLQKILELLEKSYEEVLFIVGQDLFHNDNFKGETANGTRIDKVDMEKAWEDAETFYVSLINKALENSKKVTVLFIKGNHDESMAWAFVMNLKSYYRLNDRITFDTRFKERKAHMLGLNFIGTTHGDKNRNNAAANFSVEFPEMWAKATTREVHMGHLHRKRTTKQPIEITIDSKGVIVRELGTGNDIDQYHEDYGYTMAHKEFEIFEFTETKKKRIHYV